jgi:hypothetical protein
MNTSPGIGVFFVFFAPGYLKSKEESEEVVQEVFFKSGNPAK